MLLILALLLPTWSQGQQAQQFQRIGLTTVPPSPEASNLARYGTVPVGYYNGAVQLAIPVTEVTQGSLKVPISLNYSSTNNKVGEMAS